MTKRRLFISQPFTGYDETELEKQRKALHKVFAAFIGEKIENVVLINQLNPEDPADVRGNFRSDKEQDFYRFCRSIGFLGTATDIVLYGDWEKSRGCKLEVEILKRYGIHIIDQKLLIAFCIENNMATELEELWPEEVENLKGIEEEIQKVLDDAYPLCVIKDRYGGVYSGGEYTAWRCGVSYIPEGVFEDDVTCGKTWGTLKTYRDNGTFVYGVGETPDDALHDLAKCMIRNSKIQEENE